ncbi:PAS domain S-box protein [bacterium]|nr:PAS domain S-box protein [bacterium]
MSLNCSFYKNIVEKAPFGFAHHKILLDENGVPIDYEFLDVNQYFETLFEKPKESIVGKKVTDLIPTIKDEPFNWIGFYGDIALNKKTAEFEQFLEVENKWFKVNVFSDEKYFFSTIFTDITKIKKIENSLLIQDNLFKKLSQQIPGVIYQYQIFSDGRGCFPFASNSINEIYEVSLDEVKFDASKVLSRLHPEDFDSVLQKIMNSKDNLTIWEDEYRVILPQKGIRWLHGIAKPELQKDKSVLWHGYIHDITDKKIAEMELKNKKEQFELAINGTNDGIWDWDLRTNQIFLSKRWKEILGYQDFELENEFNSFASLVYGDDIEKINSYLQKYLNGEIKKYSIEFRMRHKNGSIIWILAKGEALRDELGVPYRMAGSHSDITDKKMAEELLRESQYRLELAMDAGEHGVWDWNLVTNKTYFNSIYYTMLGYEYDEFPMSFDTFKTLIHPEDREKVMPIIEESILNGIQYAVEFRLICKDGTYKWIVGKGKSYFKDNSGKPYRAVGVHIDIDERKKAEAKLKASERNFRTFFETIDDMIFIADEKGEIFFTNSSVSQKLGYTDCELKKMHVLDVHSKDKLDEAKEIFSDMFQGKRDSCPLPLSTKSGILIPVETRVWFGEWNGSFSVFGISKDLSKEQEALQKFDKIFQANPALMAVSILPERLFIDVNETFLKTLGFTKNETIGKTASEMNLFVEPEKQILIAKNLQEKGFIHNIELKVRTKSGEILDGLFSGEIFETQGKLYFLTVMIDITTQKMTECELFLKQEEIKNYSLTLELKNRELNDALDSAKVASKTKSEFLSNMSHEIRTPLNGVIGYSEILKSTELSLTQQQYLDNILISANSLMGVINDILDFSKIEAGKIELELIEFDIVELLEQCCDIVKFQSAKKGVELLLNIQQNIPQIVIVDPIRVKQVIINLLSNAIKFTSKGEVELGVKFEKINENSGKYFFYVRDTGIGISEEQGRKLFKAFSQADSSTTRKYGGTGLGLTISNLLVEKMGGKIGFESVQNRGSKFFFSINTKFSSTDFIENKLNIHRVLVVDDNDKNREILKLSLENWNIDVFESDNGISALKMIESGEKLDAVIIDYHMPYLDGLETIKKIREQLNINEIKLPIILFHSSNDSKELKEECKKIGVKYTLTKPIKSKELFNYLKNIELQKDDLLKIETDFKDKKITTKKIDSLDSLNSLSIDTEFSINLSNNSSSQLVENRTDFNNNQIKILIVEDVLIGRELAKIFVESVLESAQIFEASNGLEAIDIVKNNSVDLILMDVQMPEMDGLEATIRIREYEKLNNLKKSYIIALTAGAFKEEKEQCLESGMDDFLTKPLKKEILKEKLFHFLID